MDQLSKILEACLDTTHNHPAWITDQLGTIIAMNSKASECNLLSLNLDNSDIIINNKHYHYYSKEMNHGTGCFLHELIEEDDLDYQLEKSIQNLEETINKKSQTLNF